MSEATPSNAGRIATSAAIGMIAGLAASFAMDRFQALTQPKSDDDSEPATEQAADGIARDVAGEPLADKDKPLGGQLVHYGLGTLLGIGYGIAAEFAPRVTTGMGTAFGTGTWAVLDEAAVPAAGLGDPPWKAAPATQAYSLASHIVFGLVAEGARRGARATIDSFRK